MSIWRKATGRTPSRDDVRRPHHPRVECPVCGQKVATTVRSADEVASLLLRGEPIRLVEHSPCMYRDDDTREIKAPGVRGAADREDGRA
jgi:C4-type Zn-finger protein